VQTLLVAGADVRAEEDDALWWAVENGHMGTVRVLAKYIFAPDSWRGKSQTEIKAGAAALYDKVKNNGPRGFPTDPEHLRKTASILADCALTCWERVRPAPPKLNISALPAQPRPV
jgi:hypothetical protein